MDESKISMRCCQVADLFCSASQTSVLPTPSATPPTPRGETALHLHARRSTGRSDGGAAGASASTVEVFQVLRAAGASVDAQNHFRSGPRVVGGVWSGKRWERLLNTALHGDIEVSVVFFKSGFAGSACQEFTALVAKVLISASKHKILRNLGDKHLMFTLDHGCFMNC